MTEQQKELTPQESLELIKKMMSEVRGRLIDDGFHFMLWGILVITASLGNYVMLKSSMESKAHWPWMIMPLVGVPIAIWYGQRQSKREKAETLAQAQFGKLWLAFGITLVTLIFFAVKAGLSPIPFILSLVGMATFVSGVLAKFRPLVFGGIVFWAAAIASNWIEPIDQLLLNAFATFLGYIVPGIMMRKQKRQESNV